MLLEVNDLVVHYGGVIAVGGVSFQVPEGAVVSLIGANGAGKSTILRTISGLKAPTTGDLRFQGHSIAGSTPHALVHLGIAHVPEGRHLFPKMTVRENLLMGAYLQPNWQETAEMLAMVFEHFPQLRERLSQRAGSLSGGEQQMLAIGRALMARPKLLLLDEPSAGLSPVLVDRVLSVISELKTLGTSVLLVEQLVDKALSASSRVYALVQGRVVLAERASEPTLKGALEKAYLGGAVAASGHAQEKEDARLR
jgi:branched-chain amino acid transport system ATP-binding protein